jgi:hypothetical protein
MQINIQVQGVQEAQRRAAQVPRQARYAAANALNGAAFKAREDWQEQMRRVFDRPTPYVLNSIYVGKKATPDSLQAWVYPRDIGGKGVDPNKVLVAEVFGGPRRAKRFEVQLQRAGYLPAGYAAVPARWVTTDPEAADGFGGVRGSFIRRLLSYLQAFTSAGFDGNMSQRRRAQLSGQGRWVNGRFYGAHTKVGASRQGAAAYRGGVQYFVSRGQGEVTGRGSWKHGQHQHLARGIWQRTGLYGAVVKPVFLFVPLPRYRARLSLRELGERAMAEHFPALFEQAFQRAMATAR